MKLIFFLVFLWVASVAEAGNDCSDDAKQAMSYSILNNDHEHAVAALKLLVRKGDACAMWFLAQLYRSGLGVPRNDAEADRLEELAYDHGYTRQLRQR